MSCYACQEPLGTLSVPLFLQHLIGPCLFLAGPLPSDQESLVHVALSAEFYRAASPAPVADTRGGQIASPGVFFPDIAVAPCIDLSPPPDLCYLLSSEFDTGWEWGEGHVF